MTPEQATVVCKECGRRVKARADGSPVMHYKIPRPPGWRNPWCDGGMPPHIRHMNIPHNY